MLLRTRNPSANSALQNRITQLEQELHQYRLSSSINGSEKSKSAGKTARVMDNKKTYAGTKKICYYCKKEGHYKADCEKRKTEQQQNKENRPRVCTYCGRTGHLLEKCRKRQADEANQGCLFCGNTGHFMIDCQMLKNR